MILTPFAPRAAALPWRDLIEALSDAVIVVDGHGRMVHANPASRALAGVDPGTALADLASVLGAQAPRWWTEAISARGRQVGAPPTLRFASGRSASLACSRLDDRHWAVRLTAPASADAGAGPAAHPARSATLAANATPEFQHLLDALPVGVLVFDATGLVVRSNPAAATLLGPLPARLGEASAAVQTLIGWGDPALEALACPDAPAQVRTAAMGLGPGRPLRASVQCVPGGERRWLAVIEDCSAQAQRDLARLQIDAMMNTAGVGVATLASVTDAGASPALALAEPVPVTPPATGGLAHIGRGLVVPASRSDYDSLQAALREGRRAEVRYEIDHPEHGSRWLLTRVEPVVLASGERKTSVVTLDVTEQQRGHDHSVELLRELEVLGRDRELMFSLSEVGIAFLRDGGIQRANEAMADLTGWAVEQLATLDLSELSADPAAFGREQDEESLAMAQHGRWSGERQLRRRDGRLIWVQVSKRPVHRERPVEGLIASYVDVDARHRAERAVALQAERTRSILDSALVGIVTVGPRGIEWMNRSAQRMFGGPLPEFIGAAMSCVATPEPEHPFRQTQYLEELVEGQAETFECRVRARDGREFWVVGNAVATGRERGGRQLTYALLDIERRRQAEARMSEAQAALQQVISAAPLAIALIDARHFEVLQVNEVAAAALHATPEHLIGRTPETIFPPRVAAARCDDLRAALAGHGVTIREYRIARARGAPARVWDARYVPLARAPGRAPDRLLLVATDVTEQRAVQQARLEAAIEQREMLVREVHHRIKNNLQGVAGLLQQIAERKPEVAAVIGEVVGQVQAIAHVHGLQVGARGELRVIGVVEAISASVQRTFGRPITCRFTGAAGVEWALPEAEAIPVALIVNELLTNAVKHGQHAGTAGEIACEVAGDAAGVLMTISNGGRLPPGFDIAGLRGGVSGLGLVRALLPRRHAELSVEQRAARVVASVTLRAPVVVPAAPLSPTIPADSAAGAERST